MAALEALKVELVVMLEALRLLSFNNLTSQIPAYPRKILHFLHPIRTLQNSTQGRALEWETG